MSFLRVWFQKIWALFLPEKPEPETLPYEETTVVSDPETKTPDAKQPTQPTEDKKKKFVHIHIDRFKQSDYQTKGRLTVSYRGLELFSCVTLELPWRENKQNISRIPDGIYWANYRNSPSFGDTIHIRDVPNRSYILFHHGNFVASMNPRTGRGDSLGCILVGKEFVDIDGDGHLDVTTSAVTMRGLLKAVFTHASKDEERNIMVSIEDVEPIHLV